MKTDKQTDKKIKQLEERVEKSIIVLDKPIDIYKMKEGIFYIAPDDTGAKKLYIKLNGLVKTII